MSRPQIIGIETEYIGHNGMFRGQHARIVSIIRGSVRDRVRRSPEVTDDEELWLRPVAPEDDVRVRMGGVLPKVVHATELACFRHLMPTRVQVELRLEESILRETQSAARMARKSFDDVVDEALSKHLRSIGFLRSQSGEVYTGDRGRPQGGHL